MHQTKNEVSGNGKDILDQDNMRWAYVYLYEELLQTCVVCKAIARQKYAHIVFLLESQQYLAIHHIILITVCLNLEDWGGAKSFNHLTLPVLV